MGILVTLLGTWAFFRPDTVINGIYRSFYKEKNPPQESRKVLAARILSLVWVLIGLIIALKG